MQNISQKQFWLYKFCMVLFSSFPRAWNLKINNLIVFLINSMLCNDYCIDRSSHSEGFLGKFVLKICNHLTGEHPCQSAISIKMFCNFIEITLRHGCSPVNLLHIFRTIFLKKTSVRLLLYWFWMSNEQSKLLLVTFKLSFFLFRKMFTKTISKAFWPQFS